MGLLDDVLGAMTGGGQGGNQLASILGALTGNAGDQGSAGGDGGQGGGQGGGLLGGALGGGILGNLVQQLGAGGLGDQVNSWIGNGENKTVSADETRSALGDDAIARAAHAMGVSNEEAADQLSKLLPEAINGMTPQGRLPEDEARAAGDQWIDLDNIS